MLDMKRYETLHDLVCGPEDVFAEDNRLPAGYRVAKTSVLGGLHHEYRLVKEAA